MDTACNPFAQLKVNVDGYSGSISFRIPDTLRTGNYLICPYTNWMRNFPEAFRLFSKGQHKGKVVITMK
jgi:hypothetical protein